MNAEIFLMVMLTTLCGIILYNIVNNSEVRYYPYTTKRNSLSMTTNISLFCKIMSVKCSQASAFICYEVKRTFKKKQMLFEAHEKESSKRWHEVSRSANPKPQWAGM